MLRSREFFDSKETWTTFSATYKDGNWLVSGYCFDHDRQLQILISAESGSVALEGVSADDGKDLVDKSSEVHKFICGKFENKSSFVICSIGVYIMLPLAA